MNEKQRNVWFSVLLVAISGVVFFSLGVGVAWKWGFPKGTVVVERPFSVDEETQTTTTQADIKIDLNTASAEDLTQIAGIGEATAKNIIAYREKIGKYTFIEQLLDVGGIGEKKLNSWSPYLFIDAEDTTVTTVTNSTTTTTSTHSSQTATTSKSTAPITITTSVAVTSTTTSTSDTTTSTQSTRKTTSTTVWTGVINLNTATAEELMQIKGIGEKTAADIIAYRDEIGGFTSLEQLMDIKGIGEKKLAAWRQYLTLED